MGNHNSRGVSQSTSTTLRRHGTAFSKLTNLPLRSVRLLRHRKASTVTQRLHRPPSCLTSQSAAAYADELLPPPPASMTSSSRHHYGVATDLVPMTTTTTTTGGDVTADYGLLPVPDVGGLIYEPCGRHHRAANTAHGGSEDSTYGHVTYCSCGRKRRITDGGGGGKGSDPLTGNSPPDVAVAVPVVDGGCQTVGRSPSARRDHLTADCGGGSRTLNHSQQQQQQQPDKIYQDRLAVCNYSTFLGRPVRRDADSSDSTSGTHDATTKISSVETGSSNSKRPAVSL